MSLFSKTATLGLVASSLIFSACGQKSDEADSGVVTIPDAPDAAMQTVIQEFANGNGGILWDAMPASYQSDVNAVVQLAGTKLDAEAYDRSFALIGRLGQVADKQKEFIFNTSLGEPNPEDIEKLQQAFPSIVGFLQTLSTSDLATLAGVQSFEGQKFFETTVSKLLGYSIELSKLSDETQQTPSIADLRNVHVVPVEVTDAGAKLELTVPGEEAEVAEFVKVENRWVPAEMATEWTQSIAEMKAKLEGITPEAVNAKKPQIMGVLTMIDGVLTQIEAAETQEQFDQAVQGAMMPLMGLMMMGQSFGGASSAPAAMPAAPVQPSLPSVQ